MSTISEWHDQDSGAWALKTAEWLRQGRVAAIDLKHLVEELTAWRSTPDASFTGGSEFSWLIGG